MASFNLTTSSNATEFKTAILTIIIAARFVEKYRKDLTLKAGSEPPVKIRGIKNLQEAIKQYNQRNHTKKGSGGASYVLKFNDVSVDNLILCFNDITEPPVSINVYERIIQSLGLPLATSKSIEKHAAIYINQINEFGFCQSLVDEKFKAIDPFKLILRGSIEQNGKTQAIEASTIKSFLETPALLTACDLTFKGTPNYPRETDAVITNISQDTDPPKPDTKRSGQSTKIETPPAVLVETVHTEFYIGHYLNTDQRALLSSVTLSWNADKTLLTGMTLKQKEDLFGKEGISFTNTDSGIQNTDVGNPIFVVLKSDDQHRPKHVTYDQYQQITIEKECKKGIRWGSYSTIVQMIVDRASGNGRESVPVSGLLVLQQVSQMPNLQKIADAIEAYSQKTNKTNATDLSTHSIATESARNEIAPDLIKQILSIRYQLRGQLISLSRTVSQSQDRAWTQLQKYVGRYICYYIRLTKRKFETSHIEIFPDGSATLEQYLDKETTSITPNRGFVRVEGDRLWLYFGSKPVTGYEPIRFLVFNATPNQKDHPRLFGIFSSETQFDNQFVSGQMIMVKQPDNLPWPKFISKDPTSLVPDDFNIDKELKSEDIIQFFSGALTNRHWLTDGPIWAEVTNRLVLHPALSILEKLCTVQTPFDNNKFYYYTFKKETPREKQWVIERNLVTFNQNGTVTINASKGEYKGYVYHFRHTLRLSLVNYENGFLELFIELNNDTTNHQAIKILYGLSLWRSTHRIQAKMVVLSRYGDGEFQTEGKLYYFTSGNEKAILEAEELRSGGAISYLRGNLHRYLHNTVNASSELFRPRDQTFREMNFLIACYYGYLLKPAEKHSTQSFSLQTDHTGRSERQLLKACHDHLKEAYTHGYACNFAGLALVADKVIKEPDYLEQEYEQQILEHILKADKEPLTEVERKELLQESATIEILKRIKQIAAEQLYLVDAFGPKGPLNRKDLIEYARSFWPTLLNPPTQ